MFDALLGKKFTVKCKHAIKCINERLKPIRNRKQTVVSILKKDVAELLRNGDDIRAFSRMDELLVEMNRLACYDMIDNFCQRIYKQLPLLQKQRECPPEDMEPVATLTFAAARFSDLPELCNLRTAFMMHYGNPMEGFVNKEFKEKIAAKTFPQVKKIQLMEDIASEFSVPWNPNSFNHKNPSVSGRNRHVKENPPKNEGVAATNDGESVKKTTNKLRSTEPENLIPPAVKATEEDQQKKKPDVNRRVAQPFKSREEIADQPQPNVDLGPQAVNQRSPRGNPIKEKSEKIVDPHKPDFKQKSMRRNAVKEEHEKTVDQQRTDVDLGSPVVNRKSTRAQARVTAVGQDCDREDSPHVAVNKMSIRGNAFKEEREEISEVGPHVVNRRSTRESAIKEEIVDLGPQVVNKPLIKERALHAIPPPYVKSIGPKTDLREKDLEEVNDGRPKPRSVRRKPPQDERRIVGLDKEEDVDQLLIYYSKKRISEQKGKEQVNNPPTRHELDQLTDRFSQLKNGGGR